MTYYNDTLIISIMRLKLIVPALLFVFLTNGMLIAKSHFHFIADFQSHPVGYEFFYGLQTRSYQGSIVTAINYKEFSWGLLIDYDYFSFEQFYEVIASDQFTGAFALLRFSAWFEWQIQPWLIWQCAFGSAWMKSAFEYGLTGIYSKNRATLALQSALLFHIPWQYFVIEIFVNSDFYLHQDFEIHFIGGIRFHFYPYVKWTNLYLEISGMPWFYHSTPVNTKTGLLIWSIGLTVDHIFDGNYLVIWKENKKKRLIDIDTDHKTNEIEYNNESDKNDLLTQQLLQAKPGDEDSISLNNIRYDTKNNRILPSSYKELDQITQFMMQNQDYTIGIKGAIRFSGNPVADLEISLKIVDRVFQYLTYYGISTDRIKRFASANVLTGNNIDPGQVVIYITIL